MLGENAIVGTGSVVTKYVPDNAKEGITTKRICILPTSSRIPLIWCCVIPLDLTVENFPVIPTVENLKNRSVLPDTEKYVVKSKDGADSVGLKFVTKEELQPTCMSMGEAAGIAAAWGLLHGMAANDVRWEDIPQDKRSYVSKG